MTKQIDSLVEALKQRRVWAGIFATIAFVLPLLGINIAFDAKSATDAVLGLVEAISSVMAIFLPIYSYLFPKN